MSALRRCSAALPSRSGSAALLRSAGLLFRLGSAALLSVLLCAPARSQPAPEMSTGWNPKPAAHGTHHMVVAAHPLAARAGAAILEAGGNAIDAAIAVQFVLNVVEPQSSGIGGGAFILFYDARRRKLHLYDGRETAPQGATESLFLDDAGRPLSFVDALIGGRSVGTPGLLRLLELVHRRHGRLPWSALLQPAIDAAEGGVDVSPRLYALLEADRFLRGNPAARAVFYREDGHPVPAGTRLQQPLLAQTLRLLARRGADGFYTGPVAADIVQAVRTDPRSAGQLGEEDLLGYRAKERAPVCAPFREYRICGAPPPSSGGVTVLEMLRILERTPFDRLPPASLMSAHLFSEAGRLAFADRDRYLADPDFVSVPAAALLAAPYIEARRALIDPRQSMGSAAPGQVADTPSPGPAVTLEQPSTTHLSIVDGAGNAVAMTSSIESAFGSRTMVRGFLLNNQLTDFSFAPRRDGRPVANRVQPGKRPRSTMAPTIVFDARGDVKMLVGSPGGSWIANYVAQVLALTLADGEPLEEAVATPHWGSRNGPTELERGTSAERMRSSLELLGHTVRVIDMTSGVHAIERVGKEWVGAADPRREGAAVGR